MRVLSTALRSIYSLSYSYLYLSLDLYLYLYLYLRYIVHRLRPVTSVSHCDTSPSLCDAFRCLMFRIRSADVPSEPTLSNASGNIKPCSVRSSFLFASRKRAFSLLPPLPRLFPRLFHLPRNHKPLKDDLRVLVDTVKQHFR